MKVIKFGGASVNSASAVKNVASILKKYENENAVVIFSAMGKMTNAFEEVAKAGYYKKDDFKNLYARVKNYHYDILKELFNDSNHKVFKSIERLFNELKEKISETNNVSFDEFYDRIVPFGELISTTIVSAYLSETGFNILLLDARELVCTDDNFRDASVNWELTNAVIKKKVLSYFERDPGNNPLIITQGFIGGSQDGLPTTLGREGSDFTASVFAYCLDADEVIIWKNVDGLLNADPEFFSNTVKIEKMSYKEAIELSFYGAKILHPKTIKPLQNKNIPLRIKSFSNPQSDGSVIRGNITKKHLPPFIILKQDQVLISFNSLDFSFITERKLYRLFGVFNNYGIKINLMQNSAISFSVCVDEPKEKLQKLINELKYEFEIRYNSNLELITIRHFDEETLENIIKEKKILLEQRSRTTIQLIYIKKALLHRSKAF